MFWFQICTCVLDFWIWNMHSYNIAGFRPFGDPKKHPSRVRRVTTQIHRSKVGRGYLLWNAEHPKTTKCMSTAARSVSFSEANTNVGMQTRREGVGADLSLSQDAGKWVFDIFPWQFTFPILNEAHKQYSLLDTISRYDFYLDFQENIYT